MISHHTLLNELAWLTSVLTAHRYFMDGLATRLYGFAGEEKTPAAQPDYQAKLLQLLGQIEEAKHYEDRLIGRIENVEKQQQFLHQTEKLRSTARRAQDEGEEILHLMLEHRHEPCPQPDNRPMPSHGA